MSKDSIKSKDQTDDEKEERNQAAAVEKPANQVQSRPKTDRPRSQLQIAMEAALAAGRGAELAVAASESSPAGNGEIEKSHPEIYDIREDTEFGN